MGEKKKWPVDGKKLSAEDISKLEQLARDATPGPREWGYNNSLRTQGNYGYIIEHADGFSYSEYTYQSGENTVSEADKAFIAACDPATILALVKLARTQGHEVSGSTTNPLTESVGTGSFVK